MQHDLNGLQGGKLPPSVVMQETPRPEEQGVSPGKGNFAFLSAYALSLRDPGLFAACYTVNPKQILSS